MDRRADKVGENTQYFIIAADDDQTIYSWCGATPDAVLAPEIPEDHKIIVKDSHRVPRTVHARANRLIHQVTRRLGDPAFLRRHHSRPAHAALVLAVGKDAGDGWQ